MSESVVRVGFVLPSLGGGGAERSTLTTAAAWPERENAVLIVAEDTGHYRETAREATAVASLDTPATIRHPLRFARSLKNIVRKYDLNALVSNGFGLNQLVVTARELSSMQDVAVVLVERNNTLAKIANRQQTRLRKSTVIAFTRWSYPRADAIVGISAGVSTDLQRLLGETRRPVQTIHNPIDVEAIRSAVEARPPVPLAEDFRRLPRPIVISVGRLTPAKAHSDLLAAFAQLPPRQAGTLAILGEGPLRDDIVRDAARLGITSRLWMPGFVENPWWYMARSDVFALSSHWEGFARVLLEAVACGIPVVSTDCPSGPRELLGSIASARLVPVGDSLQLAQAIGDVIASPVSAVNQGLDAFRPACIAAQYHRVVQSAVHRRRKRRGT